MPDPSTPQSGQGAGNPRTLRAMADAARTILAMYRRAAPTADVAARAMWAARLADVLEHLLLAELTGPAAQLEEIRNLLSAFDRGSGGGRQYVLEQVKQILDGTTGGGPGRT